MITMRHDSIDFLWSTQLVEQQLQPNAIEIGCYMLMTVKDTQSGFVDDGNEDSNIAPAVLQCFKWESCTVCP